VRLCRPGNSFCGSSGGGWYWGWGCAARASIRDAAREVERLWILWTLWTNRVAPGAGRTENGHKKSRRARLRLPRPSALQEETGCGSPSSVCKRSADSGGRESLIRVNHSSEPPCQ
jgi:hypothetical protein